MNRPHRHHRTHGDAIRLERWHRMLMYGTALVLAASGLLWLVFHYFVHYHGNFGPAPHPLTAWWLRLHGAAAMLALVATGSLVVTHMRRAWRAGLNRRSGGALAAILVLLIVSGYLLYYAGDDDLRAFASLTHWIVGIAVTLAFPLHVHLGRRRARRPAIEASALSSASPGPASMHHPRAGPGDPRAVKLSAETPGSAIREC